MKRFLEPSTWAGFGLLLQALKIAMPAWSIPIEVIGAAAGGVAVYLREHPASL